MCKKGKNPTRKGKIEAFDTIGKALDQLERDRAKGKLPYLFRLGEVL